MTAAPSPQEQLHQTRAKLDQACRRSHQSPEPDCPRRSSLPDTPETASPARDLSPQRSASSDPPAAVPESLLRESHKALRFHTARVRSRHRSTSSQCLLYPQKRTLLERVGISAL